MPDYRPLRAQVAIGALDQRVTFEQDTSQLIQGEKRPNWETVTTVWANVEEKGGSESGQVDRETARGKIVVTVRYNSDFTDEALRVLWDGNYYDVTHVGMMARKRFMVIDAQRQK